MDRETVGWQEWDSRSERPGRFSRKHYTEDGKTTLCGVKIPDEFDVANMADGNGQSWCNRCLKADR